MSTEVKEVSRIAKAGEYIKLLKSVYYFNEAGDVLKVEKSGTTIVTVLERNRNPKKISKNKTLYLDALWAYEHKDYVVLENYVEEELWKTLLQ